MSNLTSFCQTGIFHRQSRNEVSLFVLNKCCSYWYSHKGRNYYTVDFYLQNGVKIMLFSCFISAKRPPSCSAGCIAGIVIVCLVIGGAAGGGVGYSIYKKNKWKIALKYDQAAISLKQQQLFWESSDKTMCQCALFWSGNLCFLHILTLASTFMLFLIGAASHLCTTNTLSCANI